MGRSVHSDALSVQRVIGLGARNRVRKEMAPLSCLALCGNVYA